MITVGIDLAASAPTTAIAKLDGLRVVTLRVGVDDDEIAEVWGGAEKIGIDCPFGWPEDFVDFLLAHRHGFVERETALVTDRKPLVYRATDRYCQCLGVRPLSVSADRIGHAALRCAGLLRRLGIRDRSGACRAVETYPAGSLRRWNPDWTNYRRRPDLGGLPGALIDAGLRFESDRAEHDFRRIDHAFDAVVAALTAAATVHGLVVPLPDEYRDIARVEGWIALPKRGSLPALLRRLAGSGA